MLLGINFCVFLFLKSFVMIVSTHSLSWFLSSVQHPKWFKCVQVPKKKKGDLMKEKTTGIFVIDTLGPFSPHYYIFIVLPSFSSFMLHIHVIFLDKP